MGTGKFVEITAENETLFEDVLKNKLPLTGQLLNVWRLRRQGKFTVENSVKFYIYLVTKELGCVQDIFVLCVQEPNMHGLYSVIIHAPVSPTHEMIKAFEDFVEWDRNPLFPAAPGPFTDAFLKPICLKRGGIPPKEHACEAYALDGDRAMTGQREYEYHEKGDRIRLADLTLKNVNQVMATELTRVWMHSKMKQQMELSISNLATAGAFINDDLAAFAMLSPAGLMNNVWTEEPFRRRGLAAKVLQTLSHSAAEMGCTPMAECTVTNDTSRQLLKKLGFTFVQETNWVTFKKLGK